MGSLWGVDQRSTSMLQEEVDEEMVCQHCEEACWLKEDPCAMAEMKKRMTLMRRARKEKRVKMKKMGRMRGKREKRVEEKKVKTTMTMKKARKKKLLKRKVATPRSSPSMSIPKSIIDS